MLRLERGGCTEVVRRGQYRDVPLRVWNLGTVGESNSRSCPGNNNCPDDLIPCTYIWSLFLSVQTCRFMFGSCSPFPSAALSRYHLLATVLPPPLFLATVFLTIVVSPPLFSPPCICLSFFHPCFLATAFCLARPLTA